MGDATHQRKNKMSSNRQFAEDAYYGSDVEQGHRSGPSYGSIERSKGGKGKAGGGARSGSSVVAKVLVFGLVVVVLAAAAGGLTWLAMGGKGSAGANEALEDARQPLLPAAPGPKPAPVPHPAAVPAAPKPEPGAAAPAPAVAPAKEPRGWSRIGRSEKPAGGSPPAKAGRVREFRDRRPR